MTALMQCGGVQSAKIRRTMEKCKLMRTTFFVLLSAFLFELAAHNFGSESSSGAVKQPIFQTLKIMVPKKVQAVHWSIQNELCVLQITFMGVPQDQERPKHSSTQVWLLKADGTVIPPKQETPTVWIASGGSKIPSICYTFPPSARTEAMGVVVSINDQLFVERLTPNLD